MTKLMAALQPYLMSAGAAGASSADARFPFDENSDETIGIKKLAAEHDAQAKAIAGDRRLTEAGRGEALGKLTAKTLQNLDGWNEKIPAALTLRIGVEAASLRRKTEPKVPSDPMERLTRELRYAEIRRGLEGIDPVMLELSYGSMGEDVQAAIREAPPRVVSGDKGLPRVQPLVSPEVVADHAVAAAAAEYPDESAQIQQLQELRGTYQNLERVVRMELQKTESPPSVEALAAAAEGSE